MRHEIPEEPARRETFRKFPETLNENSLAHTQLLKKTPIFD
jgi:hypothetical protein